MPAIDENMTRVASFRDKRAARDARAHLIGRRLRPDAIVLLTRLRPGHLAEPSENRSDGHRTGSGVAQAAVAGMLLGGILHVVLVPASSLILMAMCSAGLGGLLGGFVVPGVAARLRRVGQRRRRAASYDMFISECYADDATRLLEWRPNPPASGRLSGLPRSMRGS